MVCCLILSIDGRAKAALLLTLLRLSVHSSDVSGPPRVTARQLPACEPAAVLPQFVDRGAGQFGLQVFLLGVILVSIALASDTVWALLAARLRTWLSRSPRRGRLLGTVGGVSMIGLSVSVAFTGNHSK